MTVLLQSELFGAPSFPNAGGFCPEMRRSPGIPAAAPARNRTGGSGGAGASAACGNRVAGQPGWCPETEAEGGPAAHLHFRDLYCPHLSASFARAPAGPGCSPPRRLRRDGMHPNCKLGEQREGTLSAFL